MMASRGREEKCRERRRRLEALRVQPMGQRADPRASVGFEGEEFTRQLGGSYVNVKGETWPYPLHEMLVHVVNHSTYHRGQVATMLRQLGKTPLSTDYLVLLDGVPER